MSNLGTSVSVATAVLESLEKDREHVIACSRKILRLSKKVIHAVHDGKDPAESL